MHKFRKYSFRISYKVIKTDLSNGFDNGIMKSLSETLPITVSFIS